MADLQSGWHALEYDAWRWTEREFAVRISGVSGAVARVLKFRFTIPAVVIEKVGPIRLDAEVNGVRLGAESFATPGSHVYVKSCPPLAEANGYQVKFTLDRCMPPDEQDRRERGLIVLFDAADPPRSLLRLDTLPCGMSFTSPMNAASQLDAAQAQEREREIDAGAAR